MMLNQKITGSGSLNFLGQDRNQPDTCSPLNRSCIGGREARLSPKVLFVLIGLCLASAFPAALFSQTAHFSGAIRTLASGLNQPTGVTVDANGNVFFADSGNNAIKEVVAVNGFIPGSPTIEALGSGFKNPTGVAVDSSGNVYVGDDLNNALKEILAVNGSIPPSPTIDTLEQINSPYGVAVSASGALFFSDLLDNEVLRFLKDGRIVINPPVGSGYYGPRGIAVDNNGNVFVADSGHDTVEEVFASGGYATMSTLNNGFNYPSAVAVDASGNVFVADDLNNALEEIVAVNGSIPANPTINVIGAQFFQPQGVAVDGAGNLYVGDTGNGAVREIVAGGNFGPENVGSANSVVLPIFFTFDTSGTAGATKVLTQRIAGLDFTDTGTGSCKANTAYIAGEVCTVDVTFTPTAPGPRYGAVELLDTSGNLLATGYVRGTGVGPRVNFLPGQQSTEGGSFVKPYGAAVDGSGNVFVTDYGNNSVGEIERVLGHIIFVRFASGFSSPAGLAIDGSGNLFVADHGNSAVKEILAESGYSTVKTVGSNFNGPLGVAVDGSGNVFVADSGNGVVKEVLFAGGYTTTLTLGSGFTEPASVAVDGSGNVFVADYLQNKVKELIAVNGSVPPSPAINTLGSGFSGPTGVAVDVDGNVLVADTANNEVKEIVAVNGSIPSSPTINILGGSFSGPSGVAVEAHGNIFVADSGNQRIEKLDYADPPSLQFASTQVGSISSDSPQSVTLVNGGNSALNAISPGVSVPPDFKLVAGSGTPPNCTAAFSLAAGAGCNLSIEFAPLTVGNPLSESLVLTDNSLNAGPPGSPTQSILLNGIATSALIRAVLTTPTPGSTLSGPDVTFTWTAETGATEYHLWLGSTGVGSSNLKNLGITSGASVAVTGLPVNGETIYARLWTSYNGNKVYNDYTYTATKQAALTSPTPSSTLPGPNVTFSWSAATGATEYYLWLGSTGVGSSNLKNAGITSGASVAVTGLPVNGETVYARLWTSYNGIKVYTDYTYTATKQAALTSPTPSSTLAGPNVTFSWSAATGATEYYLWLGSTGVGSSNLKNAGITSGTSVAVTGLPVNGETIYARLWTSWNGDKVYEDYTYKAH